MSIDASGPSLLPVADHLAGLRIATQRLAREARATWLGARVPTCPDWTVLDLVAHQGMVHRWATAALRRDGEAMGNAELLETEGRTSADPVAWLEHGSSILAATLGEAPEDTEALVFLEQAPPPRAFWARRQCHETTVHAFDAFSAASGRLPSADDVWFGPELAADGIDELLIGFWQRGKVPLRSAEPYAVLVAPDDLELSWLVTLTPDAPVHTRRVLRGEDASHARSAGSTLSGSSVDLYLALWNRGGSVCDPDGALARFRDGGSITW